MEIFIFWLALSIIPPIIAINKGRSGAGFFFLSILLSPIIGIIAALVAKPNQKQLEAEQIASGYQKKCPYCAELIKKEARICRHCAKEITA